MIKVLYIVGSSAFGGATRHVYDLCSRLDRSVFDLVCISPPDGTLPQELTAIGTASRVIDLYRYADPATWRQVVSCIRQEKPDVVHAHGPSALLFASFGNVLAGSPALVCTFHSMYLQEKLERMHLTAAGRVKTTAFMLAERWAARRASILLFVSDADRSQFCGRSSSGCRSLTVHNGIDLCRFTPGVESAVVRGQWAIGQSDRVVGCVSRLSAEKGVEYLLRAFPRILACHENARLLLVGDGVQRREFEVLAGNLGVANRVIFTGHSNDVPGLLSSMDVVVLPSLWEGQPLAVLEAWAMEKPVVATRVKGTASLVDDGGTGVLVPACDPAAIASAVSDLLADPGRARRLGQAGRRVVQERFDLEKTTREIAVLYERLAGLRRPPARPAGN